MKFVALGPFVVPVCRNVREIDFALARKTVFKEATLQAQQRFAKDINDAIGCYIFGLSPPRTTKVKPFYVGQACRQSLRTRIFQGTKEKKEIYNGILQYYRRSTSYIYILPLLTAEGRIAKQGSNKKIIDQAEHTLIGMARVANSDLWNLKHRAAMDAFSIEGVFNSNGNVNKSARDLKLSLNI